MLQKLFPLLISVSLFLNFTGIANAYDLDDKLDVDFRKAVDANCPEIKIKDPAKAAALGFLPGGGSFYTGQIGLGILDIILWPISILWDSPGSAARAIKKNKLATVEMCKDKPQGNKANL